MTNLTVLVGAREAAAILGVTTQSVAYMRERGALCPVKSKPYRFRLSDVEALRTARATRGHRQSVGVELSMETK